MTFPRALLGTAGGAFLALAVLLALELEAHYAGAPVALDLDASARAAALRGGAPWVVNAAEGLNWLGGGFVGVVLVPVLVLLGLLLARRPRAALTAAVALALSAGVVQVLKWSVDRARPEGMLVTSDPGSFPSGHTANAATLAVLAVVLVSARHRWWVGLLGALFVVVMGVSRLVLSVHWATDLMGGVLVGIGAALVAVALLPPPAYAPRPAPAPPPAPPPEADPGPLPRSAPDPTSEPAPGPAPAPAKAPPPEPAKAPPPEPAKAPPPEPA